MGRATHPLESRYRPSAWPYANDENAADRAVIPNDAQDASHLIQIDHDRIRWMMAAKAIGLSPAEEPAFIELCTAADAIRMESYLFIRLVGVDHQIAQLERRRDALLSLMHPSRRVR